MFIPNSPKQVVRTYPMPAKLWAFVFFRAIHIGGWTKMRWHELLRAKHIISHWNMMIYKGRILSIWRTKSLETGYRQVPEYTIPEVVLVGWLCWGLTSQSTIFQSYRDGAIASWVINQYFRGVKCLAQGHNTAAVGLEPRTSRSGVRHSTTEPPRSPGSGKLHHWNKMVERVDIIF